MNKKWYSSSSFYGAFIFAVALWGYTSLNDIYNYNINVPLDLILPRNRALRSDLPTTIGVQFRGSGWDLFNINFGNNLKAEIDLSDKTLTQNKLNISKTDMLNSLKSLGNLEARSINTDPFDVYYGKIINKLVPIKSNFNITLKEGFKITSDLIFNPDSVLIRGNENILDTINNWPTSNYSFDNLAVDLNTEIKLSDRLGQIITRNIDATNLQVNVSQLGYIELPDIPIDIMGGRLENNSYFMPTIVSLKIEAPIEYLENLNPDKIRAYLDYKEIISSNQGIVPIHFEIDSIYKVVKSDPNFVYIFRNIADRN
ncbi:CdaR family protein [Candidatus Kapabacteria bacterium]|nr:CdaR family protein [Candidatus Kapabacteria bacterium]